MIEPLLATKDRM